jgi:hypothetical protein
MEFLTSLALDELSMNREALDKIASAAILRRARRNDDAIREMLGRWISELEPSVAVDQCGSVIGLCVSDDTRGTIVLRPAT